MGVRVGEIRQNEWRCKKRPKARGSADLDGVKEAFLERHCEVELGGGSCCAVTRLPGRGAGLALTSCPVETNGSSPSCCSFSASRSSPRQLGNQQLSWTTESVVSCWTWRTEGSFANSENIATSHCLLSLQRGRLQGEFDNLPLRV